MPKLGPLALLFLRIGNTTVGGGEPTVAALQQELSRRNYITPEQFGLAYALARLTPGTNMLAFCAAAGWYALGLAGAFAGVLAVSIPSSVLVVWLTRICEEGDRIPWLGAAVKGMIAAAAGITVAAAFKLADSQIVPGHRVVPIAIVAGAFLARLLGLPPLYTLALAATAGLLWRPR